MGPSCALARLRRWGDRPGSNRTYRGHNPVCCRYHYGLQGRRGGSRTLSLRFVRPLLVRLSFSSSASGTLESNQVIPAYQAGAFTVWLVPVMWNRVESHHRLLGFDQALVLSQLRALAVSRK